MIDLSRCAITAALGIWDVDETQTFEAGTALGMNAQGKLVVAVDGASFRGIAKWNKTAALTGVVVDDEVVLSGTTPAALQKANLVNNSEKVTSADGATTYTSGIDYDINYVNGTVARIATGNIPDGATVKVTYRYELSYRETQLRGSNYMGTQDDTAGTGKMTLIQDYAIIYTDQYDTTKVYSIEGANSNLTVENGKFRPAAANEVVIARVIQSPSASDGLLGIQIG